MNQDPLSQIRGAIQSAYVQAEIARQKHDAERHGRMTGLAEGIIIGGAVTTLVWLALLWISGYRGL